MLSEMKTETITTQVAFEDGQVTFQMEELSLVREHTFVTLSHRPSDSSNKCLLLDFRNKCLLPNRRK